MKIKTCLFLALSFLLTGKCDLIPNDRVVTNPDSGEEDFTLVEGITYNIVHWKSGMYLDGNDKFVQMSYVPFDYWTFRKALGAPRNLYNIIQVNSGRNLDANRHRKVYVSSVENNSKFNRYQHWSIRKLDYNNKYNIQHKMSEYRNLDSNYEKVYIGEYKHSFPSNPFQHWKFEPRNYKLEALVTDVVYPPDLEDGLSQHKTRIDLLSNDPVIKNPTNVTIKQVINETAKRINRYALEIDKSEFFSEKVHASFRIEGEIFSRLKINTNYSGGIEREFTPSHEEMYKEHISEEIVYRIQEKITVPPFTSVKLEAKADRIVIDIPFTAKIRITGKADRLTKDGKVVEMTNVDADALKCYLQKENYNLKGVVTEGNSLIISTTGNLKVDGYGVNSIKTIPIPPDESRLALYSLYAAAYGFTLYYIIKLFKMIDNNQGYSPIS